MSDSPSPGKPFSPALNIRRILAIFVLIFVSLTLLGQAPREVGRWKLAQAIELRGAGNKDAAYQALEDAIRWFPDDPLLVLQRADWRRADGDEKEAAEDLERILELPRDKVELLTIHGAAMLQYRRFAEAVKDWEQLNVISERTGRPSRVEALNQLAYAQALAQIDLNKALEHANKALELVPGDSAILDTRGYILYLNKDYEAALADMNAAIKKKEGNDPPTLSTLRKRNQAVPEHVRLADSKPKVLSDLDASSGAARVRAVLRYHRALVLLALGKQEEAEADLKRVRELTGKEPDESLF